VACARPGGWVCAKTAKTERVCSVSGTPCETAVGAGGQGWCDVVVVVVVMVRPSAGMRKAREWVRTEMTETERPGSVSGGLCEKRWERVGRGGGVVW